MGQTNSQNMYISNINETTVRGIFKKLCYKGIFLESTCTILMIFKAFSGEYSDV